MTAGVGLGVRGGKVFIVTEGSEYVWKLNVEEGNGIVEVRLKWGYGYSCHHFGTRSRPYNKQTDAKPKTDLFVDRRLADVLTKRSSAFAHSVPGAGPTLVSGALLEIQRFRQEVGSFFTKLHVQKAVIYELTSWRVEYSQLTLSPATSMPSLTNSMKQSLLRDSKDQRWISVLPIYINTSH